MSGSPGSQAVVTEKRDSATGQPMSSSAFTFYFDFPFSSDFLGITVRYRTSSTGVAYFWISQIQSGSLAALFGSLMVSDRITHINNTSVANLSKEDAKAFFNISVKEARLNGSYLSLSIERNISSFKVTREKRRTVVDDFFASQPAPSQITATLPPVSKRPHSFSNSSDVSLTDQHLSVSALESIPHLVTTSTPNRSPSQSSSSSSCRPRLPSLPGLSPSNSLMNVAYNSRRRSSLPDAMDPSLLRMLGLGPSHVGGHVRGATPTSMFRETSPNGPNLLRRLSCVEMGSNPHLLSRGPTPDLNLLSSPLSSSNIRRASSSNTIFPQLYPSNSSPVPPPTIPTSSSSQGVSFALNARRRSSLPNVLTIQEGLGLSETETVSPTTLRRSSSNSTILDTNFPNNSTSPARLVSTPT